ncbi:amino acid adenylation domain-containing protein [Priestia sp. FSL H7-0729]
MIDMSQEYKMKMDESLGRSIRKFSSDYGVNAPLLLASICGYYENLISGSDTSFIEVNTSDGESISLQVQTDRQLLVDDFLKQRLNDPLWQQYCTSGITITMNLDHMISDRSDCRNTITIGITEEQGRFLVTYQTHSEHITHHMIKRMHARLLTITEQMITRTSILLRDIELISDNEKQEMVTNFNKSKTPYDQNSTFIELFEAQVDLNPDYIAFEYKGEKITYKDFNGRANRVGQKLREMGAKPDHIIGIITERSVSMMVGIYGILKSGAAYMPIDPELPDQRIQYLLENSGTKVVLAEDAYIDRVRSITSHEILPLSFGDEGDEGNLERISKPESLAYVIYTSGTTGLPKGVMVENRNLVNFTQWMLRDQFTEYDIILAKTTYAFDLSIWELFVAPLAGAKVILLPKEDEKEPSKIMETIKKCKVTRTSFVPSVLEEFTLAADWSALSSLTRIVLSGEALPLALAERFYSGSQGKTQLVNCYGPTEATVFATSYAVPLNEPLSTVHIGNPISNMTVYIMNEDRICGVGMPGELYIGGAGVTRGYINKPDLTAERFLDNPYVPGERIYRTGDLACWMEGGNLQYLGRIDDQVKIRGYRIELAEVTSKLRSLDMISNAVVIKREDHGYPYLCGYFVAEEEIESNSIKQRLAEFLPKYMIPSHLIQLDKLPVTSNGKLDKRALPKPDFVRSANYVPPAEPTEILLTEILQEVLGLQEVGMTDQFFELGGDSLRATRLVNLIEKRMSSKLSIKDVFNAPVVRDLLQVISRCEQGFSDVFPSLVSERLDVYPMSYAQKRMFVVQQMDTESLAYNVPFALQVRGKLDDKHFAKVLQMLLQRHEILRTHFVYKEGEFRQIIDQDAEPIFTMLDGSMEDFPQMVQNFVRPFDLGKAPLMRAGMMYGTDDVTLLLFDIHHIIFDDGSKALLLHDIEQLYNGNILPPLDSQYKDYSLWQNSRDLQVQEEYWLAQFHDEIPVLNLKTDYPRPMQQSYRGSSILTYLDAELHQQVKQWSQHSNTTPYMLLMSCFMYLLNRYSRQEEVIIGSPIAGRIHPETEHMLGMFVNTLAIKAEFREKQTFRELLQQVREKCLEAYEHQEYPFEQLVEKSGVERDPSRHPIFDVMFVLQDNVQAPASIGGFKSSFVPLQSVASSFDLTLSIEEGAHGYELQWEYCQDIFKQSSIAHLAAHFESVLKQCLQNPDMPLSSMDWLSAKEKETVLNTFNDNGFALPTEETLISLFEDRVEKSPNQIAVEYGSDFLTYANLNKRANAVAKQLRTLGVVPNQIVGLALERCTDMIVGMLGILKAGGAYLPIDPNYPVERIKYMLQDSSVTCVVTGPGSEKITEILNDRHAIQLENYRNKVEKNLSYVSKPSHLAYVIYTSGTTGKPKGVMIEHLHVVNQAIWQMTVGNYDEHSVVIQKTTHVFDGSVWEIFPCLIAGSKLKIIDESQHQDPEQLLEIMPGSHIALIPSMLRIIMEYAEEQNKTDKLRAVKQIYLAAEPVTSELIQKFEEITEGALDRLSNLYGPTEATVTATSYSFKSGKSALASIGKPIFNTRIYILNDLQLCGVGIPGELCIAGAGVARGYMNLPELTEEKFVKDPFHEDGRMYRSGDLARWTDDGNIEFLGRIGEQVKIRGFRIEVSEVESKLREIENVLDAACVPIRVNDELFLAGYVVGEEIEGPTYIREEISKMLPSYMVPSYIKVIAQLPLTSNGKLDKRALPTPYLEDSISVDEFLNETESTVQQAFMEVLGMNKVSLDDSFFDLGGHSLRAMRLINKLDKSLGHRLAIREILMARTVRNIAGLFSAVKHSDVYDPIESLVEREWYPVSAAQKRIYMIHEMQGNNVTYNIPMMFRANQLNLHRLKTALDRLCERYELMRTSFSIKDGDVRQTIADHVDWELWNDDAEHETVSEILAQFVQPFNLNEAPLWRVGVHETLNQESLLMIDVHHIIFDEGSKHTFISDLLHLYNGDTLPELKLQYKDYAVWEQRRDLHRQEQYWLNEFAEECPVLDLQTDFPRPREQSHNGDSLDFSLDKETSELIKGFARHHGTTEYAVLMSVFMLILSRYSRQNTVVVGSPVSGRVHPETEDMLGMFVNTLPIKGEIQPEYTFVMLLKHVQEKLLAAGENQEYPFDQLADNVSSERDPSRNPIFDVVFVFNEKQSELSVGEARLLPVTLDSLSATFDLTVSMAETDIGYNLHWEYCTDLFLKETITRMANHYDVMLKSVLSQPEEELVRLPMLSEQEKHWILQQFNATDTVYPSDRSVVDLFHSQAVLTPDQLAVVSAEEQMTYRELEQRSNQLAEQLRRAGVERGDYVGIMAERNTHTITGILAILKVGAAYMPIDPKYPNQRIAYMLKDSRASVVLIGEEKPEALKAGEVTTLSMLASEGARKEVASTPETAGQAMEEVTGLNCPVNADDIAYLMYTSGTTGEPKGVMVEHRSINRLVKEANYADFTDARILQTGSLSFDASTFEIWGALLNGGCLYLVEEEILTDPASLKQAVSHYQINTMWLTVSLFNYIVAEQVDVFDPVSQLIIGGEQVSFQHIQHLREANSRIRIVNGYGPTESTTFAVTFDIGQDMTMPIPIGKPISNTQVYILENEELCGIGVPGEICIGGDGLARGYLNLEELTKERFRSHPMLSGGRLYHTGDLGRWREDGNIEYLGRMDQQVKIRGFRIELDEIVAHLRSCPGVQNAVVTIRQDNDEKFLCGYLVGDDQLNLSHVRKRLEEELPSYMVPSHLEQLGSLPLTPNGKLDQKALPMPDFRSSRVYIAPTNPVETVIADAIGTILGVEQVSLEDNFFELGGHSLKATKLVNAIDQALGVRLTLRDILVERTAKNLSVLISSQKETQDLNVSDSNYSYIAVALEEED